MTLAVKKRGTIKYFIRIGMVNASRDSNITLVLKNIQDASGVSLMSAEVFTQSIVSVRKPLQG